MSVEKWEQEIGWEYTARSPKSPAELDGLYLRNFGISRMVLNRVTLAGVDPKNTSVLEVGCNIGLQLRLLEYEGFKRLVGLDVNAEALSEARLAQPKAWFEYGKADDIPYENEAFELVFTSGLLIHIPPEELDKVLSELYRISSRYIWGFEYYANKSTPIEWRGKKDLLWKDDYCSAFYRKFPSLKLLRWIMLKDKQTREESLMYLLEKGGD